MTLVDLVFEPVRGFSSVVSESAYSIEMLFLASNDSRGPLDLGTTTKS